MASEDSKNEKQNCILMNPYLTIRKLVDLMEHPISENATERHLHLLNNFLNASHYAFWLRDIPYIIRLYEVIIKKIDKKKEFKKPLECLLHFSAIPPMLTKISDQIEYKRDFQEYFTVLGYMVLCIHSENLSRLVLTTIINLLETPAPVGYCCVTQDYIKEAAEKSQLPEILAQIAQVISDDLYPLLLDTILLICNISKSACKKMASQNAIDYLLRWLDPNWKMQINEKKSSLNPSPEDKIPHLKITCFILWKLLNSDDNETEKVKTPTIYALWSLQYALRWLFICPRYKTDRNNLIGIILKILDKFPDIQFVESGLAHDITLLVVSATGCLYGSAIQFTDDEKDFHFKKLIWACLLYFKNYNNITEIILELNLISTLLKYLFLVRPSDKVRPQYCSLIKIIIKVLPEISKICINKFLENNGPLQFSKMVRYYLDGPYDITVLEADIYCIHKFLQLKIPDVVIAFGEACIFSTIAPVCNKLLDNPTLTDIHQRCIGRSFCILQIMSHAGYTSSSVMVDLCIKYLNRVIHPNENDPVLDVKITTCAIHLLWESLSDKQHIRPEFVKKGGVYVVLDLAQMCPFPVKTLALGLLVDLCRTSLCVPYLITWRKRGLKLLPMLMQIFRGQAYNLCNEEDLSIDKTNSTGAVLSDGTKISFLNYCTRQDEIVKSCRYKIHGILYALHEKHKKKVDLANSFYHLYTEDLNADDELTMVFAKNLLSLLMCKDWLIISKELKMENVSPVESDRIMLKDKIQQIYQWKRYLRSQLEKIIKHEKQQEKLDEFELYSSLNEARLSNALDALQELKYISNCTERMFQFSKRIRISREIEPMYKNMNYHRTTFSLPYINVFNQNITIESNFVSKEKSQEEIAPVSSDEDESFFEASSIDEKLSVEPFLEC